MIAAIAQVIHLQGIAVGKDTAAPSTPHPYILSLRVAGHPEAVHVAETVTCLPFVHDTGIILYRHPLPHFLLAPQCQSLGRYYLTSISTESHLIVSSLRLHAPKFRELSPVQTRLRLSCQTNKTDK